MNLILINIPSEQGTLGALFSVELSQNGNDATFPGAFRHRLHAIFVTCIQYEETEVFFQFNTRLPSDGRFSTGPVPFEDFLDQSTDGFARTVPVFTRRLYGRIPLYGRCTALAHAASFRTSSSTELMMVPSTAYTMPEIRSSGVGGESRGALGDPEEHKGTLPTEPVDRLFINRFAVFKSLLT
ncbi:hypothetical protein C8J56DRAFT_1033313 [Mycena floridula]|nr:hypothetical protein C8J56DRAFT_1033313 [Mycena floridula]